MLVASNSQTQTDFSATDAALGYLYQVRWALLSSLQRLAQNEEFAVYLETLDDVVFDRDGSASELLQMKHHCDRAASLTDASPDIWKSLRVWIEGRENQKIPKDAKLYLITTSKVGEGSSASYLTIDNRDEVKALARLRATVNTSTNQKNEPAYKLFRCLQPDEQAALIGSVVIFPNAPNIVSVEDNLRSEARLAVRRNNLDSFLTRLEGWWYQRVISQLNDSSSSPILGSEIESEFDILREQFKPEALPVDQDILNADIDVTAYEDAIFVHQVRMVGISNKRIFAAIRDYYRAFEQRSRWVREDLVLVGELDRYEQLLREEWELQFDRISDELGENESEEIKREVARKIYAWVEDSSFPIRSQVQHPSMTSGSFHMLSDRRKVGWHPEFMQHLQQILEPKGVT